MDDQPTAEAGRNSGLDDDLGVGLFDLLLPLIQNLKLLIIGSLLIGVAALGVTYLIKPTFTSRVTFLVPQQQQSAAASAIASLGTLSGLAGAAGAMRSPADQYVSLLQSNTVTDRLIDEFKLLQLYGVDFRIDARIALASRVRIAIGKKDGLISIEVDDADPQRAASIANRHVDELRRVTAQLALTEAQQRRIFFEAQLKLTRDRLVQAQQALQSSGFNAGALKAEPRAAAEGYARLRAEVTSAEVRLQSLRQSLADASPEVQQLQSTLGILRTQLAKAEENSSSAGGPNYIGSFREFKYQETLFDLFARQYELARLDESRESVLIQVVDSATPAERRSRPRRAFTAIAATAIGFVALVLLVLVQGSWRRSARDPGNAERLKLLRSALRGG